MPPDPMLGLLALLAVFVYAIVGSVVAVGLLWTYGELNDGNKVELKTMASRKNSGPFYWTMALWPLALIGSLVLAILAGICFVCVGIGYGPYWVAKKIGAYGARSIVGELQDAT